MNLHRFRIVLMAPLLVTALAACAGMPESDTTDTASAMPEATSGPGATPSDPGQTFADMDANRDGRLSQDEVSGNPMLTAHFSNADTDADGALSPAEVEAHRTQMSGRP